MKILVLGLLAFSISLTVFSQNNPTTMPPEYYEMLKKNLPPGTQLPPELMRMMQQSQEQQNSSSSALPVPQPLIPIPPVQQTEYSYEPSPKFDYSPFGSGLNEAQRWAALKAVEAWLNSQPLILPLPESAPTKEYILKMAEERNKLARQKFDPDDLTQYSRLVNWVPRFDGKTIDTVKAAKYSMAVALSTNNNPYPYFNIALAAVVFSLAPDNPVQANNLASAIISGGEIITEKNPTKEALAPFRRDAESAFLYAISHSMDGEEWSEASLTPVINLGNLCIDLKRLEEARSLFMVARKIKPQSWDAALGLAAYFLALNQKDKALAILEDENLDLPQKYAVPVKANKELEKSEPFSDLPPESPEEKYEEGINIMNDAPIHTSADFIAQLDQSERNKMRHFIENLTVKGSFTAPPIHKLTQYASLKVISGPQGMSALNEFSAMLGMYSLGSFAATTNQQLEWLAKFGMKIDPGVDMDDVAKHPEKYVGRDINPDVKVTGKEEFLANMQAMGKDAEKAKLDLATGKTESLTKIAAKIDKMHAILLMDPEQYADPMNVIMQKMNYTVYQRKTILYKGYLHSVTKKTYNQISEIIAQCNRKLQELAKMREMELDQLEEQRKAAEKNAHSSGNTFKKAEWDLKLCNTMLKYAKMFNNIEETGFGSATNVASIAYMQKIKPMAEKYYYDVFRHIAMISDPEVRDQKNADFRNSITSALTFGLNTVMMAYGSFSYTEEPDCSEEIAAQEAEAEELEAEENDRIERNKAAKAKFDSGEIPESSPLFKKLDAFVDEYNFGLVKVRASCARTVVEANTDFLPNNLPFNFHYKSVESENTGAITRSGGIKAGYDKEVGNGKVSANVNMDVSVSSDGNGVVKNYSVTGGAEAGVKVGNYSASAGVSGKMTDNNGVTDYSVSGNANASVKYGNTKVSGGASVSYSSKGVETDFSAGVSQDFKNGYGTEGNVKMEASTKRGCSLSGKVEHTLTPAKDAMGKVNDVTGEKGIEIPSDFTKKEVWSGKFELK